MLLPSATSAGLETVGSLAAGLICLCHEAAEAQADALLQQLLAALRHLAAFWPAALAPHVPSLALLLLQQQQSISPAASCAALSLLARLLDSRAAAPGPAAAQSIPVHAQSPALLLPLVQQAVFGGSQDVKQWAAQTLAAVQQLDDIESASSGGHAGAVAAGNLHGPAAAAAAAMQLVQELWHRPLLARHWPASLRLSLLGPAGPAGGRDSSRAVREQQQLDGGSLLVLCSLLQHPAQEVQRAALRAAEAAVQAAPLLGLTLLPLLVHQLQAQVERFLSGEGMGGWAWLLTFSLAM